MISANRCDHIQTVDHGYIDNYSQSPGSSITVVCDAGYKATGSPSLSCDRHGRWSAPPPSCVRDTTVADKGTIAISTLEYLNRFRSGFT